MSELVVPVATVENIRPHENSDNLLLCDILGYQLVIGKNNGYYEGQKVIYVPNDVVMPDYLSDQLGVTQYLSKGRVRAIRLRGEPSYGLTMPIPEGKDWEVGENVAKYFGLKKYYPPVRQQANDAIPEHPLFYKYTDIENMRTYPYIFSDPNERVIFTEKIHGCCVRLGVIDGTVIAGSRKLQRKQIEGSIFWFPYTLPEIHYLLEDLGNNFKQAILYGEVFGGGVQVFDYGSPKQLQFRAFDLLLDGKYVDFDSFHEIMDNFNVPTAPVLYDGPFVDINRVRQFATGKTKIAGTNLLEGVVVKPAKERFDAKVGRVILKYLSDDYLQLKEKKDIDSTDQ